MALKYGEYLKINNAKVKQSNDIINATLLQKLIGETLHLKFCKTILGLNI